MLAGTQVRLAPLYDVASYLPHDDTDGYKIKLAMKIGDDYKLRRTDRRSAWEHAADELKLDRWRLVERVVDLATCAPDALARAAAETNVEGPESHLPERLAQLVTDRSRQCVAALT